jgi:hypothetical protein
MHNENSSSTNNVHHISPSPNNISGENQSDLNKLELLLEKLIQQNINKTLPSLIDKQLQDRNTNLKPNNDSHKPLTSARLKEFRTRIYRVYDKKIRMENHKRLFETHKTNKTVPQSLIYSRFPKPFLWDNQCAVDSHNSIIRKFQAMIIDDNIDKLSSQIASLEADLNEIKTEMSDFKGDLESCFENIRSSVEENLKDFIDAGNNKLIRLSSNNIEDHLVYEYEAVDQLSDDYMINYLGFSHNETKNEPFQAKDHRQNVNSNSSKPSNSNNGRPKQQQNNKHNNRVQRNQPNNVNLDSNRSQNSSHSKQDNNNSNSNNISRPIQSNNQRNENENQQQHQHLQQQQQQNHPSNNPNNSNNNNRNNQQKKNDNPSVNFRRAQNHKPKR